jgi:hypothetical protein
MIEILNISEFNILKLIVGLLSFIWQVFKNLYFTMLSLITFDEL